jgi:hypothetical protein
MILKVGTAFGKIMLNKRGGWNGDRSKVIPLWLARPGRCGLVIASAAKQFMLVRLNSGLFRRLAPRNDGELLLTQ